MESLPPKILIYHTDSSLFREILAKRLPDVDLLAVAAPEEAADFIQEAEIILSWKIPDELLKRAKKLRWFASLAAGNEHLVNNPHLPESLILSKTTVYGEMMVEYVFAYLLSSIRDVEKYSKDQKKKMWDQKRPERLRDKVLGILGLGSVGKEIAKHGKEFGMHVIGLKRIPEPVENVDQVFGPRDLEKMIPLADYLVVVLPFTPETYHVLGEKELDLMREGTTLFSIGRGKTIDEGALINVLKTKKIKAVLDVFETEPLPPESELWSMDNVVVTPHVSGINLPEEICEGFAKNYERWIKGEPLMGLIDRQKGY
jgi:glyoxylate/hydroxypyruvate reductase A